MLRGLSFKTISNKGHGLKASFENDVAEMVVKTEENQEANQLSFIPLEDHGRPIRGGGGGSNPIEVIKAIVALGERAWDLVIQGKPVLRSNHIPVSVLPQVEGRDIIPMDLERWSLPKSKVFFVVLKQVWSRACAIRLCCAFYLRWSIQRKRKFLQPSILRQSK